MHNVEMLWAHLLPKRSQLALKLMTNKNVSKVERAEGRKNLLFISRAFNFSEFNNLTLLALC